MVTKREFAKVVKVPFERAFSIPCVKAGFAKCGIYPLNKDAISKEKMTPSTLHGGSGSSSESVNPRSSSSASASESATVLSTQQSPSATPQTPLSSSGVNSDSPVFSTPARSVPTTTLSSSGVSSASVSPPLFSSPSTSFSPPIFRSPSISPIVNPLVAAGLIPEELSDILATPPTDAAVVKKRTKRITGATARISPTSVVCERGFRRMNFVLFSHKRISMPAWQLL